MSSNKEVFITAAGALTPLGNDVDITWTNALHGKSGVLDTPFVSPDSKILYSGAVRDFDIGSLLTTREQRKEKRDWGRSTRLAIGAASEALRSARFLNDQNRLIDINPYAIGCIVGSGGGDAVGVIDAERQRTTLGAIKPSTTKAFGLEKPPGAVAKFYGIKGHTSLVAAACASTGEALYLAESLIRSGEMNAVLVIGVDGVQDLNENGSLRYPVMVQSYEYLDALSTTRHEYPSQVSRPFDRRRDGFVPSEGALGFVLETADHARAREIKPLARIRTVTTNNASGDTDPDVEVMGDTFEMALVKAGLTPDDLDLIIPHATSTPKGDIAEKAAMTMILGRRVLEIPMCPIKSMTGHLLGASGGMGALIAVKAILTGWIPPTLNFEYTEDMPKQLREQARLTEDLANSQLWLPNRATQRRVKNVLSNTFGFAGHNAVSIICAVE